MSEAKTETSQEPRLFDLIDHFCMHIKLSAGASTSAANTAESYANALQVFKRFIRRAYSRKRGFRAPYPVSILDHDVLLAYYDWLTKASPKQAKKSPQSLTETDTPDNPGEIAAPPAQPPPPPRYAHATIQHYIAAVKRFLSWSVSQDYVKNFDLGKTEVKLKGGRGQSGKAYPHRKIDPNLAAILLYYDNLPMPKDPDQAGQNNLATWQVRRRQIALLRNRAIVYVLFETGLRVSELTSLKRDEVDRALKNIPLPEDTALEVVGKGGRRRTVWITRDSLVRIKAYLEARNDPSDVLFVGGKKGVPITRQMVWKIVKDGAEAAGVGDFTGPHAFRHWLARQLFNDEEDPVPMEDVQALLGHASPTTTRTIYAPHSSNARLHRSIKKARKRPEETINRSDQT
jgi:integrase